MRPGHQEKPRSFPHTSSPMPKPRPSWSPKEQKSLQGGHKALPPCFPPQHPQPWTSEGHDSREGAPSEWTEQDWRDQKTWGQVERAGQEEPDEAGEEASSSPRTPVHRQLLWWRSCPRHQPPQAQAWWPPWGTQGRWAAARREDWPPPPSETQWTPGFLQQHSLLQSPWLSSQPGETRNRSYPDLILKGHFSISPWSGHHDRRLGAAGRSSLINSTGSPLKTERFAVER